MSWALFIDESGQDRGKSPYEVLAGIAIEDRKIWNLSSDIVHLQEKLFGMRLFEAYGEEAKAKKLLKKKVFKHAGQMLPIPAEKCRELAFSLLTKNSDDVTMEELTAFAQAKLNYCHQILELVYRHRGIAFATIIPQKIIRPSNKELLRKDYNFLFERFYYHLEHTGNAIGYLIFDELEKSASHILLTQIKQYFTKTQKGQRRAKLIIPEALFVHSDLTTLIQVADLIAYIISWGFRRNPKLTEPHRSELDELVEDVTKLQFCRPKENGGYSDWGFKVISVLDNLK